LHRLLGVVDDLFDLALGGFDVDLAFSTAALASLSALLASSAILPCIFSTPELSLATVLKPSSSDAV
jgi:hypothetical protein